MVFTRSLFIKLGGVFEEYIETKRTRKSTAMAGDKDRSEVTSTEETTETHLVIVEDKLASIDSTLVKLTSLIEENTPKKKPKPKSIG